jgi:ATP-dependent DNA helicase RecG
VAEQLKLNLSVPMLKDVRLLSASEIFQTLDRIAPVDLKEDRRIERKTASVHAKSLADYFSIFANTPPEGGVILIGVEDDGTVTGCRRVDATHISELERAGDIYCPEARYECKTVPIVNKYNHQDSILAIWVRFRSDKAVETSDGSVFIRRGSSRRKLSREETRELQNTKGQVEIERELISLKFPDDFKAPALNQFISGVREMRGLPDRLKLEEILELRKLGTSGKSQKMDLARTWRAHFCSRKTLSS